VATPLLKIADAEITHLPANTLHRLYHANNAGLFVANEHLRMFLTTRYFEWPL
jgi:hypothetical protein